MLYELEPISFATLQRVPNRREYFYQEVADAHLIIANLPLNGIQLVVHKYVDAQGYTLDTWRVSDRETATKICSKVSDNFDRDKAIDAAIAVLEQISEAELERGRKRIRDFKKSAKRLQRRKIRTLN